MDIMETFKSKEIDIIINGSIIRGSFSCITMIDSINECREYGRIYIDLGVDIGFIRIFCYDKYGDNCLLDTKATFYSNGEEKNVFVYFREEDDNDNFGNFNISNSRDLSEFSEIFELKILDFELEFSDYDDDHNYDDDY
jgi:hypothetical protein